MMMKAATLTATTREIAKIVVLMIAATKARRTKAKALVTVEDIAKDECQTENQAGGEVAGRVASLILRLDIGCGHSC